MRTLACLVLALGVWASPYVVEAAPVTRQVTDVFVGTATTGSGSAMPIDLDLHNVGAGPNGTLSIPYTFSAQGRATGGIPGSFVYAEHGALYLNPATLALIGSSFQSGVFILSPHQAHSRQIDIADTSPHTYQQGTASVTVHDLPNRLMPIIDVLIKKLSLTVSHGVLNYGYFTFTNHYGTFTGVASPDFRQFAIRITFDAPVPNH